MKNNFLDRIVGNGEYSIVFGKRTLVSAILSGAINWLRFWLKSKFGIKLSENDILKLYYEFDRLSERMNLDELTEKVDQDEFYEFLNGLIGAIDEEWDKNPEFLENRKLFWEIFVSVKQYMKKEWLDSSIRKDVEEELNRKIIEKPELLNYKVKRDVDMAINDYEKKVGKHHSENHKSHIYTESAADGSIAQSILGGEMQITSTWKNDQKQINNDD